MIEKVRALFPIEGDGFRVELLELDTNFFGRLRMTVFDGDAIRDIKEQEVELLPGSHRDDRGLACLATCATLFRERSPDQVELMMPHDLLQWNLLLDTDLEIDVETVRRVWADPRAGRILEVMGDDRHPSEDWFASIAGTLDPARRSPPPSLRDDALEAAIREHPDERSAYAVYGDWLAERGDPRGELVAVQCALADQPNDLMLRARDEQLRTEYAYELLGELAWWDARECELTWRYGFTDRVRVGTVWADAPPSNRDGAQIVRACAKLPLVRELVIAGFDEAEGYDDIVRAIARHGTPRGLASLGFIVEEHRELGDLEPAYPALAMLDALSIETRGVSFGEIDLPALRSFELITRGLTRDNLAELRAARWPKLERFAIAPGDPGVDNCDVELEDLGWILDGSLSIKHLGILGMRIEDVIDRIATSAILPNLVSLDLSRGYLRDIEAVRRHAERLAHLERLVLPPTSEIPGLRVVHDDRYIPVYE